MIGMIGMIRVLWILSLFVFFIINFSFSSKVDELKQQIFYIKQRIKEKKTKLYYQNLTKKEIERQLNQTWQEITEIEYKILVTNKEKQKLQKELKNLSNQVESIKLKIFHLNTLLENKVISFLKYNVDLFVVLFNAKNPDVFIDCSYFLRESIKQDIMLINELNEKNKELIEKNRKLLEVSKKLQDIEKKLKEEKKYYNSILERRQELLRKYQEEIDKTKQDIEYYESIQKEKYEELQRYIVSNINRNKIYRGGKFLWPTNSYVLTSYFGYRVHPIFGTTRFHSGVDIGASYGAPVYAAADGVVIYAGWYYGYGNTVIIDHGSGISTLYAHCSVLNVYKGQTVYKGQIIARVGSTGNSTGPHLHFEVQINGRPVNPLNYL